MISIHGAMVQRAICIIMKEPGEHERYYGRRLNCTDSSIYHVVQLLTERGLITRKKIGRKVYLYPDLSSKKKKDALYGIIKWRDSVEEN